MKLILHIGTEKTGTTSLQNFLNINKNIFNEKGIYVVSSIGIGNNRNLATYAMRDGKHDDHLVSLGINSLEKKHLFNEEIKKVFIDELNSMNKNIHTVIISSEHFHSRLIHKAEVLKLYSLLNSFFDEIEIVVYLRPQIDMAISLYTTILRSGSKVEFNDFLSSHCVVSNPYYNYYTLLELWSTVFGEKAINVRLFDKSHFLHGDLLSDFLSIMDLEYQYFQQVKNVNESLNPFGQELLRLNNIYNYQFTYKDNNHSNYIKDQVEQLCIGKGMSPNKTVVEEIQHNFNEINSLVAQKWFSSKQLFLINFDNYKISYLQAEQKKLLAILFGSIMSLNDSEIDTIRDSALLLENIDLNLANNLMNIAAKYRPTGLFIKEKLKDYKYLLEEQNFEKDH